MVKKRALAGASRQKSVVVAGDVAIDWNIARDDGVIVPRPNRTWARICRQAGGAALLAEIIEHIATCDSKVKPKHFQVHRPRLQVQGILPSDPGYVHSFVMWDQFDATRGGTSKGSDKVWRVCEFLGVDRVDETQGAGERVSCPLTADPADASIVVLDDAGTGFRNAPSSWPKALHTRNHRPWVVVKMSLPLADGALWKHLVEYHADRLIVVASISDMRHSGAALGQALSWERTASDLAHELAFNPQINELSSAAHVIIVIPTSGALIVSRDQGKDKTTQRTLLFDSSGVERDWMRDRPGRMMGYTCCVTACIVRELMKGNQTLNLKAGVLGGLRATRLLHEQGYGRGSSTHADIALKFPIDIVDKAGPRAAHVFSEVEVPHAGVMSQADSMASHVNASTWTILGQKLPTHVYSLTNKIVTEGVDKALSGVPIGRFGKLVTVDRSEIESLLSVRAVMEEYLNSKAKTPLSVAVFGPPGSGKSFAVNQIAQSLDPSNKDVLTFNLTQMANENELIGALHQVRDRTLTGRPPLVFWDEFDTQRDHRDNGWLASFLAPMQDGTFQVGQVTHQIGRALFVFAGGINSCIEEFDKGPSDGTFKAAKGPDFVSRLKGHINVMGINPEDGQGAGPAFVISRAIKLRVLLMLREPRLFNSRKPNGTLDIDVNVLHALLHVPEYKHGVRSMSSIIAMSSLTGRTRFDRSCLPPESQAELHVDGAEFRKLLDQFEIDAADLKRLAAVVHTFFCQDKVKEGWKAGRVRNDAKKEHNLIGLTYEKLPKTYQESNRAQVRGFPRILASIGCAMMRNLRAEPSVTFTRGEIEVMAEVAHEVWMEERWAAGVRPGRPTEDDPNRHPNMVDWNELTDKVRQTDRDMVRRIPEVLAVVGYVVVRVK